MHAVSRNAVTARSARLPNDWRRKAPMSLTAVGRNVVSTGGTSAAEKSDSAWIGGSRRRAVHQIADRIGRRFIRRRNPDGIRRDDRDVVRIIRQL